MSEYDYFRVTSATTGYAYIGFGASSATMSLSDMPYLQYSVNNSVDWQDFTWAKSGSYFYTTNYPAASNTDAVFIRGIGNTAFTKNFAGDASIVGLMAYDASDNVTSVNVAGRMSSLLDYETMCEKTVATAGCFASMFGASPKVVDVIDASGLILDVMGPSCYVGLFGGTSATAQTNLVKMPQFPITTLADRCYYAMFKYCSKIKLSTTQTSDYRDEFTIPTTGTGTTGTSSLTDMFTGTGGTFTGTPTINTIYYSYAEPFYIEAVESTTITLSKQGSPTVGTCKYGIDNMSPSTSYTYGNTISLTAGQRCYFNITESTTDFTVSNYLYFTSTGKIKCGGRLTSLIGNADSIPRNYCFTYLFYNCTTLVDASNLIMCNNFNSKTHCYYSMFNGCTSLVQAPALPATTLTNYCYFYMFHSCTSLTQAPELPATTLANNCYYSMFQNCTSLTQAPELPATTLADRCYQSMFSTCTSLTQAPELPATTLANNCYYSMFKDCTSLARAPALPATTLAINCYQSMFKDCTSLTQIPELPATTLTNYCYYSMFNGCTSIKLSTTLTGEYRVPYRIPTDGTGTAGTNSLTDMFTNTGGTFTETPSINTTYYLWDYSKKPYIGTKQMQDGYIGTKKILSMWSGNTKIYG